MKIAFKEALETDYWLQLCQKSEGYPATESLQENLTEVKKVLNRIIATTTKSLRKKKEDTSNSLIQESQSKQ